MPLITVLQIKCDHPHCGWPSPPSGDTPRLAAITARRHGWLASPSAQTYQCPGHRAMKKVEAKP